MASKPASKAAVKSAAPLPIVQKQPNQFTKRGLTLDINKPYGEVCGGGGAKFEQNGKLFDISGRQCDLDGKLIYAEAAAAPAAPVAALKPAAADVVNEPAADDEADDEAEETGGIANEDDLAALSQGGK